MVRMVACLKGMGDKEMQPFRSRYIGSLVADFHKEGGRRFHIRDAVPFGSRNWMLEIRFQKTETGGQCTPGCHKLQSYDHGQKDPVPAAETSPLPASAAPEQGVQQ